MIGKYLKQFMESSLIFIMIFFGVFFCVSEIKASDFQGPFYADKDEFRDYITVNMEEQDGKDEYKITMETKALAAVDWIGFVIRLDKNNFKSFQDLKNKSMDKRATYNSEDEVVGILYAESKNFYNYLDVSSLAIDMAMKKALGTDFSDSVLISKEDDDAIYMIRAYSGGSGILNDFDEKKFVFENVDNGSRRHKISRGMNIFLSMSQVADFYIPVKFSSDDRVRIATVGINAAIREGWLGEPDLNPDNDDFWEVAYEVSKEMMSEIVKIKAEKALKETSEGVFKKFINMVVESSKLSLENINVVSNYLKATSATQRYTDMALFTTPIETSYIMPDVAITSIMSKHGEQLLDDISIFAQQIEELHSDISDNTDNNSESEESNNENDSDKSIDDNFNSQSQKDNDKGNKSANDELINTTEKKEISDTNVTKLTIEFIDQYGHNVIPAKNSRRGHGMIFGDWYSELKIFDVVDDSLPGSFKATIKNDKVVYEYNKDIIAGEYKLQLGQTANEYYTSFIRYYLPIDTTVIIKSDDDLYHKINITQEAIGYFGVLNITLTVTNQLGTPLSLSLGASGEKRYLVNELGNKVGSGFSPMLEEDGKYKVSTSGHYIEPGWYTVHIKEKGYNPVEITFTLPDLRQYTDEEIINMDFGEIDLGEITMEKL